MGHFFSGGIHEQQKELLSDKWQSCDFNRRRFFLKRLNCLCKEEERNQTSMVLKHQVESIVLVAGDGDFVPASKLARREGVDFILDPMWAHINPDLEEHVDGIKSVLFSHGQVKDKVTHPCVAEEQLRSQC